MLSGIVTGGSFLTGDNFVNPAKKAEKAFDRYEELLNNEKLIEVLKIGRPFEGVLDEKCPYAAEVFTLKDGDKEYIAIFNYSKVLVETKVIDVPENSVAENLLNGKNQKIRGGKLVVTLQPNDSVIYEIVRK